MVKTFSIPLAGLLPALLLSACSSGSAATPGGVNAAYTAAAQTVFAAQTAAGGVTPTALPSLTPLPQGSPSRTPTGAPTLAATSYATPNGAVCDSATFVSDVTIPDGTVMSPGTSFVKTWSIRNTGTCDWTATYALAFLSGSALDGSRTKLSAAVKIGDAVNISVGMYAPLSAGTYVGIWRMQNAVGTFFGDTVFVKIVVSGGTVTTTITATKSGTASSSTNTPTPTPVNTSTPTPAPTNTTIPPTETPTT
jgi:hypothetical protein